MQGWVQKKMRFMEVTMDEIMKKLLIILAFAFLFLPLVSSMEWDNLKTYDEQTKILTFSNSLLKLIPTSEIATAKLETPQINYVIAGKDVKVAEFTIDLYIDDYQEIIKGIELINLKNGKAINRTINYKYKVENLFYIDVIDTKEECLIAKNLSEVCENVIVGSHQEERIKEEWLPLEKLDMVKGKITIGLFTEVNKGDYVEWYPILFGTKVTEWATWSEALNTGLVRYYNFNESSGNVIERVFGKHNATNAGQATYGSSGIIGNAGNFTGQASSYYKASVTGLPNGTQERTLNFWIYRTSSCADYAEILGYGDPSTNAEAFYLRCHSANSLSLEGAGTTYQLNDIYSFPTNTWLMTSLIYNGTSINLYINATLITSTSWGINTDTTANNNLTFGARSNAGGTSFDGQSMVRVDEFAIWNRSLSGAELTTLYDNGIGMSYIASGGGGVAQSIATTLVAPSDASIGNVTNLSFSATATPTNMNVTNVSFWYSSGSSGGSFSMLGLNTTSANQNSSITISNRFVVGEGIWHWNALSCAVNSTGGNTSCAWATTNRTFTIDITPPNFTLNSLTNSTTLTLPSNLTLNVTTRDLYLQSCWYNTSDSSTLNYYTCNQTFIANFSTGGIKTVYVFGNDTSGNVNATSYQGAIYDFNVTQYENADPIAEGSTATIYLLINSTSFTIGDAEAVITFNGTQHPATTKTVISSGAILFSYSYTAMAGMGNSTGRSYSYNWTYNTTLLSTRTTPTATQTIISFAIDDCSVYTYQIANISHKDEETNAYFLNTTASRMEIETLVTSNSNPDVIWSFAQSFTNRSSIRLCVPQNVLNNTNMTIDMTMGYEANGYVREFFYLDNGTLGNTQYFNSYTPHNITLYDLLSSDSTTFLFEFTDENGLEVDDAIVHTYRKYIGEGVYREVERSRQDDSGQTHVHLVEEDVIYYFVISQNGHVIYTSTEYNAKCLSTPCTIELSATQDFTEFPTNWDYFNGVNFNVSSNKTTRLATLTFLTDQLIPVNFTLFKYTDGEIVYINSTSLTATAGTVSLRVPNAFGNATFFASVFIDGDFAKSYWIDFKETAQDYFGTTGAILGGLMVLAVVLMAVSEGVGFIVFTVLAVFIVGLMQLIDLSWMALISILCAGGIIIWKLIKRRRTG